MELDQWTSLDPSAFKQQLLDNYETDETYVVDLYNALIQRAKEFPTRIAKLAEAAVEIYVSLWDDDKALLFLELLARANLANNDVAGAMTVLSRIIALDGQHSEATALELVRDLVDCVDIFGISLDQHPSIMKQVESVFQNFGKLEEIADLRLKSAVIYSRHRAFQAAYRCINDAEIVARELRCVPLMARCLSAETIVGCEEQDYRWATIVGKRALSFHRLARLKTPAGLLCNLGVAHMNLDDLEPATSYLNQALTATDMSIQFESAVRLNLSICLRRLEQLPQAEVMLIAAEQSFESEVQSEHALELALGAAKLARARNDVTTLTQRLQVASERLDRVLADVFRLHHRRGVRERYIVRMEELLRHIPAVGASADVLRPLVATRGNAMADWLAVLTWTVNLRQEADIESELADEIEKVVYRIREVGAPHLFGFWEKYDDPWEPMNSVGVWDELSKLCIKIKSLGLPLPLDIANSQTQAVLCQTRLNQGHCLMVTTYAGVDALLWYFIGTRYQRVAIPLQPLKQWHRVQAEYADGSHDRNAFVAGIEDLVRALSPILDPVFSEIAVAGCASVRYIEDSLRDLPLMLFAMRNDALSTRMGQGDFHVRLVPAMTAPLEDSGLLTSVAAIVNHRDDLLLAQYEADAFTHAAGLRPPCHLSAGSSGNLQSQLAQCDVLIASTHGRSLAHFTDAYFAHLGDKGSSTALSVPSLQIAAPDLEVRLAILNACYSGSRSTRNFQKTFRTSDAVAIPNLFLLNRRAIAFSGDWKISDTASFIMAHLIGDGLKLSHMPSSAVARAIALLPSMTRSAVVAILTKNLPASILSEAIRRLDRAPELGMFSASYFTAGLSIHGLL